MPTQHPGQMEVFRDERRYKVLACGRRWGKTRLACLIALKYALNGKMVWWIGPTFPVASIGWRLLKRMSAPLQPHKSETQRYLRFNTGGEIWIKSADKPDALRGEGLDLAIFDECAFIKENAWTDAIRPALSDKEGDAVFISTPSGRNWFWKLWTKSKTDPRWGAWQYPTASNPYIAHDEIEAARHELPERVFKQEYLAEFLENEGAVFRNIEACLHDHKHRPGQHRGHFIVFGVDWGKHNDYTAVSIFCTDCGQELQHDRFNQIDYAFQVRRLHALSGRWHPDVILVETNAMGEPVFEQLQREGMPVQGFQTTASTKPPLIENLALAFEKEEAMWIRDDTWTHELEAYERKVNPVTQRSTYSAPSGLHDDTVMARALAWKAATGTGSLFIEI